MSFRESKKIGRPGAAKSFDLLNFALNNGYRAFDIVWESDGNTGGGLLNFSTRTFLCNSGRLNGISINTVTFPIWDVFIEPRNYLVSGSARSDAGGVTWRAFEQFSTNKPSTTLFNRAAAADIVNFTGNTTCENADTASISLFPALWSVYQPTATIGNFEYQVRGGWSKEDQGGALCSATVVFSARVFVKSSLYQSNSAGTGVTIAEVT